MEKNNSKVCTICHKSFSSGKAMGGHMRSHLVLLVIPPKSEIENQALNNSTELTHSSTQSPASQTFRPKRKRTKSFRSLKDNFSTSSTNSDRVKESESYPKIPTRKRSKRRHKFIVVDDTKVEPNQMSLISETHLAEEAARSLLMLLKDKWPEIKEIKKPKMKKRNKKEGKNNENGRDDWLVQTRSRARYKCRMCPRTFQSHQALGGHVANHKKIENICRQDSDSEDDESVNNRDVVDQKVFECSFCNKVLKSAQALDGHKKVHFSSPMVTNSHTTANKFGGKLLDLNFPSPREDVEVTPIEKFSMVSNKKRVL